MRTRHGGAGDFPVFRPKRAHREAEKPAPGLRNKTTPVDSAARIDGIHGLLSARK